MTLRELSGYLYASLSAYYENSALYFEIDISGTGDVSNNAQNRYFSDNKMILEITIPRNKKIASIEVGKTAWKNFCQNPSGKTINLTLPPFGDKNKQEITIILESICPK